MHSEYHATDSDDKSDGTEEDSRFMICELLTVIISQSVHDEDTVIYTYTEDKGRDDDINQIKAHVE
jgi:hypothetical protein